MTKRIFSLISLAISGLFLLSSSNVFAASTVQFEGGANDFVFSNDDLFDDVKTMMPGDTRTENITVRNIASDYDYVKIFLRAESSGEANVLLSQLNLKLYLDGELLSDTSADNPGALTTDLELGTFYPGDEVTLSAEISAPVSLGNDYMHLNGEIKWIFTAEAYKDGKPATYPNTGAGVTSESNNANSEIIIAVIATAIVTATSFILIHHKRQKTA
ncbi:hypothetical protein IKG20_00140 [Candidatus Saccharibacteria bacterium]|nr:hypothetical protein [Candidatus Saccharibacteria bacterium]